MWRTQSKFTSDDVFQFFDWISGNRIGTLPVAEIKGILDLLREIELRYRTEYPGNEAEAAQRAYDEFLNHPKVRPWILPREPSSADATPGDVAHPPAAPSQPEEPAPSKTPAEGSKKRRKDKKKKGSGSRRTKPRGGRAKGVGNRKAAAYPGALRKTACLPALMQPGCACPHCQQGKLERARAPEKLRFEAGQILIPVVWLVEHVRCAGCRQEFKAELPREIEAPVVLSRATPEAAAMSILLRYGLGMPSFRLEQLQAWTGGAIDDSALWRIASGAFDGLGAVRDKFRETAANGEMREVDDASARVIELKMAINAEVARAKELGKDERSVRTGVQVTSWVVTYQGRPFRYFEIGRPHQGEREAELARERTSPTPLTRVSDAASKASCLTSFPPPDANGITWQKTKSAERVNEPLTTTAHCLEHLRATFAAARPGFRNEIDHLLELLSQVFDTDAQAAAAGLDAAARLLLHQRESAPVMELMKTFIASELAGNRKAEPNGDYRRALNYATNHWEGLTAFLRHEGIPLTTTQAELANKFTKRHHKNSLSFQTVRGAEVGAFFMSLIATCLGMKVNPLRYLAALIEWRSEITAENAALWMPDTFEQGLAEIEARPAHNTKGYRVCSRVKRDVEREVAPAKRSPVRMPHSHSPPSTAVH